MNASKKDYEKNNEETSFESHNNHSNETESLNKTIEIESVNADAQKYENTAVLNLDKERKPKTKSSEEDIIGAVIGIILTLFFGLLAAAILDSLIGYKCPNCKHTIIKDSDYCDNCHTYLRWE